MANLRQLRAAESAVARAMDHLSASGHLSDRLYDEASSLREQIALEIQTEEENRDVTPNE